MNPCISNTYPIDDRNQKHRITRIIRSCLYLAYFIWLLPFWPLHIYVFWLFYFFPCHVLPRCTCFDNESCIRKLIDVGIPLISVYSSILKYLQALRLWIYDTNFLIEELRLVGWLHLILLFNVEKTGLHSFQLVRCGLYSLLFRVVVAHLLDG